MSVDYSQLKLAVFTESGERDYVMVMRISNPRYQ